MLYKSPLWTSSPPKKLCRHHIILKKGESELTVDRDAECDVARPLKTDFYDPTSGDCGSGSCPPAPEEKGGGPGGGVVVSGQSVVKLEHSRTSQHYYRGPGGRSHPSSRYPDTDYRHRPRPPYRSNSSFSQDR